MSDNDLDRPPIQNEDVKEWLDKVQDALGPKWVIHEFEFIVRVGFLRRRSVVRRYSIYHQIGDMPEYQIINFGPLDGSEWSINTEVSAQVATAYLVGLLTGFVEGLDIRRDK